MKNPQLLSYHLLDEEGSVLRFDNPRFPLPGRIKSGQTIEITATVKSPLDEGRYILEFDLVREGISWFKDYGSKTVKISLLVKKRTWPEDNYDLTLDYGKYTKFHSGIEELNKIQKLIRITLDQNDVEFKGKTGTIHGFSAGTSYPQIWLRDANTIIPASRYFYDGIDLRSWLEEHLAFQKQNGSLEDWINSREESDKNTSETDQETSAVQAAFQIFEILGPSWLEKKIDKKTIIDRLEKSLQFVLSARQNKKYGLLTGAHTADWGDVDMVDDNQQAIYVDERTHWTADIYDQSMFALACQNLAQMFDAMGQKKKSSDWLQKSEWIKKNANKWLWQKGRGFYRIHIHLDSMQHEFDEDNIFAMGGNTSAMLAGLADKDKCSSIIKVAIARQKSFQMSTISGTLLPPYPKNTFKHPQVDDPYEYQNGGQWDWFGGKLIYSMFEHGFSSLAKEKLIEILKKNLANRGFFEWDNREGAGRGSDLFCGSAGSLGKAIFEGYFGLKIRKNHLNIEPKIGKDSAKIHIYQPANDTFVAYDYGFDAEANKILLKFNSNFSQKGKIKILIPWQKIKLEAKQKRQAQFEVTLDGVKIPFVWTKVNHDEFIIIETDFNNRSLIIKWKRPSH